MKPKLDWRVANRDKTLYRAIWFVLMCEVFQNQNGMWGYMITGTGTIYDNNNVGSKESAMEKAEQEIRDACSEFMSVEWHPSRD